MYIEEKAKRIAVAGIYDVAVVGGGIAGVAAALAAARLGKKVILFERMFGLGGLATLGLITIYLPICDGNGNQICYGIAEELLKLSVSHGIEDRDPGSWLTKVRNKEERKKKRYEVQYNAQVFSILLEQALLKEGIRIAYGSTVCGADIENSKIRALLVESKSGRQAFVVNSVIDASGDADVAKITDEKTAIYKNGNPLAAWYYETIDGKNRLRIFGISDVADNLKTGKEDAPISTTRYVGLEEEELSAMTCSSHEKLLENYLSKGIVSMEHSLSTIATIPQVRMTRRIVGGYTLDESEVFKEFDDSIGLIPDWRQKGPIFEIPFRCLHGKKIKNLLFAGRCISVTDNMWEITRVIPPCAVTGEAAGTAAAMFNDFKNCDVTEIQKVLKKNNVKIHIRDLHI